MPLLARRLLPVLLWMTLIFIGSSIQKPDGEPGLGPWDKLAHLFAYGVLGLLIARAMYINGPRNWREIAVVTLLATLYGVSDEFHQSFVPGREASAGDLIADAAGALLAAGILYWLHARQAVAMDRGTA